jgi:hypothetical protein
MSESGLLWVLLKSTLTQPSKDHNTQLKQQFAGITQEPSSKLILKLALHVSLISVKLLQLYWLLL